ncbi:hypothetical protein PENSPDRAFT_394343 [Peniophora sp. CONT]|nr:hypothetical protein PENSPDRAFT_394343 [Peniophora sp. CONT]
MTSSLARPTIVLSRSPPPMRGPRPLPARPIKTSAPAQPAPVAEQVDQSNQQLKITKPKRATYIRQWVHDVQPGSPLAPSPNAEHLHDPLLSAGTHDFARRLMSFAQGACSPTSNNIARIITAPMATGLVPLKKPISKTARLEVRSPSVASPSTGRYNISASGRRTRAQPSLRRTITRQQSRRGASGRAQNRRPRDQRSKRASRMLLTLADGGVDEANVRRLTMRLSRQVSVANRPAARVAAPQPPSREVFLDDDEWEFAPLLLVDSTGADDGEWVDFDGPATAAFPDTAAALQPGSAFTMQSQTESASAYSHESDLVSPYVLPQPHDERSLGRATPPPLPDSANTGSASTTPGLSLLAIPARSQRKAAHLRKASYVTELEAFTIPKTPVSPGVAPVLPTPKGPARRRPAPLNIPEPPTAARFSTSSPLDLQLVRAAFIAQSYNPRRSGDVGAVPRRLPTPEADKKVAAGGQLGARVNIAGGMKSMVTALKSSRNGNTPRREWI